MRSAEFFRKLQLVALLALDSYPVTACIIIFVAPELLMYMWLFPAVYSALCVLSFALPAKLRLPFGIFGAVLFLLPCDLLLESNTRNMILAFGLGYGGLLIWSMRIPGWDSDREMPMGWLGAGFVILLIGCLWSRYEPRLATVETAIRISFFVFVLLSMLSLNRGSLLLSAGNKRGFSPAMRQKNVLLTVGIFAIALAVALIPSLLNLVKWLFDAVSTLVAKVAELFPEATVPETTIQETIEATTGEGMGALFENLPEHRTSEATYIIMTVITLSIMIPVGGYCIYKIVTGLGRGLRNLTQGIVEAAGNQAEDFQDEISDTREDAESEYYRGDRDKPRRSMPSLRNMTPAERIRYRYRRLASKHPEWKHHNTARENLQSDAAQLYERARYSDHPITEQQAEEFKNKIK